jgi:hypothetical protein
MMDNELKLALWQFRDDIITHLALIDQHLFLIETALIKRGTLPDTIIKDEPTEAENKLLMMFIENYKTTICDPTNFDSSRASRQRSLEAMVAHMKNKRP